MLHIFFVITLVFSFSHIHGNESPTRLYDVAIIGSGPAGLGACLITGLKRASTIVLAGSTFKGDFQHALHPRNWPASNRRSGNEIMSDFVEQIKNLPILFMAEIAVELKKENGIFVIVSNEGQTYRARSVIIATGASPRRLSHIDNEAYFRGKSIVDLKKNSTEWHGKKIVIVGGGDDAVNKALLFSSHAKQVYLLVKGGAFSAKESPKIDRLRAIANITIFFNSTLHKLNGDQGKLSSIEIRSSDPHKPSINSTQEIDCDYIVEALGIMPNSGIVKNLVDIDHNGYIRTHTNTTETSCPGIFAAGVVSDPKYQQAFISASEGMKAGYTALEYLENMGAVVRQ